MGNPQPANPVVIGKKKGKIYVNVLEVLDCVYMSEVFFANASRPSEPSTPPLSNWYPLLILWGGGQEVDQVSGIKKYVMLCLRSTICLIGGVFRNRDIFFV
jgi:hypothetical protein